MTELTTRRLDGRSAVAVAVRRWKEDVARDLGGDLSRAEETILEAAAQSWIILASLDAWIGRQATLVTKKRALLPVVMQRMQIAEGLARHLERLGLKRRAKDAPDLQAYLTAKADKGPPVYPPSQKLPPSEEIKDLGASLPSNTTKTDKSGERGTSHPPSDWHVGSGP